VRELFGDTGDMDVNEAKLRNALGAVELEYMDEAVKGRVCGEMVWA
jgi:hypothetical protein